MYFFLFYYNKMKDIISYYEEGGNSNTPADVGDEMKTQAKEWMKLLEKEFYENANPLGRRGEPPAWRDILSSG